MIGNRERSNWICVLYMGYVMVAGFGFLLRLKRLAPVAAHRSFTWLCGFSDPDESWGGVSRRHHYCHRKPRVSLWQFRKDFYMFISASGKTLSIWVWLGWLVCFSEEVVICVENRSYGLKRHPAVWCSRWIVAGIPQGPQRCSWGRVCCCHSSPGCVLSPPELGVPAVG